MGLHGDDGDGWRGLWEAGEDFERNDEPAFRKLVGENAPGYPQDWTSDD